MTEDSWLQITGGADLDDNTGPVFSRKASSRGFRAVEQLVPDFIGTFDGIRWLSSEGYRYIAVDIEFRAKDLRRPLRSVIAHGPRLDVGYSCIYPDFEQATIEEMKEFPTRLEQGNSCPAQHSRRYPKAGHPSRAAMLVKCLDEDGSPTWSMRTTDGMSDEELLGALVVRTQLLRQALVDGYVDPADA